jgi:hypothetical protein
MFCTCGWRSGDDERGSSAIDNVGAANGAACTSGGGRRQEYREEE